jgi:hypothetical protein
MAGGSTVSIGSLEWARELRRDLKAEIQHLTRRTGADDSDVEALGLLPRKDHLADLRQRLAQVERLIEAIEGAGTGDAGWFPAMGADDGATQVAKAAG